MVQRRRSKVRVTVAVAALAASPTAATVYEIADDGTVAVKDAARQRPIGLLRLPRNAASVASAPSHLKPSFDAASGNADLASDLIEAVAWAESRFRTDARSPVGARGVMQLMPATARDLGVDAADARQNIRGGATYLRQMLNRYSGDVVKALAAYNAGPAAVDRYGGVPPYPETRAYVARILDRLAAISRQETRP